MKTKRSTGPLASGEDLTARESSTASHSFLASFKPTATAVKLDGQGDGGELVLIFDRGQVAAVLSAWAEFAGKMAVVSFTSCKTS